MRTARRQLVFHRVNVTTVDSIGVTRSNDSPMLISETTSQAPPPPDYLEQIQDLTSVERHGANAFLKAANEDSKANVAQAVKNYRIHMKNEYECPPIGVRRSEPLNHHTLRLIGSYRLPRRW